MAPAGMRIAGAMKIIFLRAGYSLDDATAGNDWVRILDLVRPAVAADSSSKDGPGATGPAKSVGSPTNVALGTLPPDLAPSPPTPAAAASGFGAEISSRFAAPVDARRTAIQGRHGVGCNQLNIRNRPHDRLGGDPVMDLVPERCRHQS